MNNEICKQEIETLDSEEFNTLLQAAQFMEIAQKNLSSIDKTVCELKQLVCDGQIAIQCREDVTAVVESMETLLDDISDGLRKGL